MTEKVSKEDTLKAIDDSIQHWRRMRDSPSCGERPSSLECKLCNLFLGADKPNTSHKDCEDCPIKIYTERKYCNGTPYNEAQRAFVLKDQEPKAWNHTATKEIEFLEMIRKENE